jgi:hypothetical protein
MDSTLYALSYSPLMGSLVIDEIVDVGDDDFEDVADIVVPISDVCLCLRVSPLLILWCCLFF